MRKKLTADENGGFFLKFAPIYFQNLEYISLIIALVYVAAISKSILVFLSASASLIIYIFYLTDLLWKKRQLSLKNWIVVNVILIPMMLVVWVIIIISVLSQIPNATVPSALEFLKGMIFNRTIK